MQVCIFSNEQDDSGRELSRMVCTVPCEASKAGTVPCAFSSLSQLFGKCPLLIGERALC